MTATKPQQEQSKERPILFSAEMVRKILAGEKTQTRRVIKSQPELHYRPEIYKAYKDSIDDIWRWLYDDSHGCSGMAEFNGGSVSRICPYGKVGDKLWCRETFRHYGNSFVGGKAFGLVEYVADSSHKRIEVFEDLPTRLDWEKNQPSIFMPRWASRITLEIVSVRVERLQEITASDVMAEGMIQDPLTVKHRQDIAEFRFQQGWDSINGKRPGCDWASNPWCWCISFRRVA